MTAAVLDPPVLDRTDARTVGQIVDRAGRPDFDRWADQVARCGHCSRPVRLRGRIVRGGHEVYSTDREPDGVLLKRCGNRRAAVCPSCSREYAADMWQLLYAGAAGGRKGVPETVRAHPLVFATLTAPGFGPVHGVRSGGGTARCRPPRGRPTVCRHGRPQWCSAVHQDGDPRLGEPLCGDCYDYVGHVAFNWYAPELWRRFTIALRRVLARRLGLTPAGLSRACRLSFVKVAEFQRRAVVHFHALIRLDGPEDFTPPRVSVDAAELGAAIREAASSVRLTIALPELRLRSTPARAAEGVSRYQQPTAGEGEPGNAEKIPADEIGHADSAPSDPGREVELPRVGVLRPISTPRQLTTHAHDGQYRDGVLRFGEQVDTQTVNGGSAGELTPERVAAYVAKYATKSAEDFGLGDRRQTGAALAGHGLSVHVARVVRTCWELGADETYDGLRRWVHMAGFRGHFASKSRRYSTTLGAIRGERREYRRREASERARLLGNADPYDETVPVIGRWEFAGLGYLNGGDAALALSAAARARERREAARDVID